MINPGTLPRSTRLAGLAVADVAVLLRLYPDWPALGRHLGGPQTWIADQGADSAAATLTAAALWLCAAWVGVGLLAVGLGVAPGWIGRWARRVTRRVAPSVLLRLVGGTAAASVALAVASPLTAIAATTPPPISVSAAPSWPTSPALIPTATGPVATDPVDPAPPSTHVVAVGDCLWTLAAHQLHSDDRHRIAVQTQRWYAANQAVIGPDPGLLHPGVRLVEPEPTS